MAEHPKKITRGDPGALAELKRTQQASLGKPQTLPQTRNNAALAQGALER